MLENENNNLRQKIRISNAICTLAAIINASVTLYFTFQPCWATDTDKFLTASRWWTSATFFILGFAFLFTGVTMNMSLKKHFPHFYNGYWFFLWTACIFLTIPLFVRAVINALKNESENFQTWFQDENNFAWTDTLYIGFSTYLPIIA